MNQIIARQIADLKSQRDRVIEPFAKAYISMQIARLQSEELRYQSGL